MLLHVETNQFSGFSFWLQYPKAEERTSAQTRMGEIKSQNIVETSLAGTKKKGRKRKK